MKRTPSFLAISILLAISIAVGIAGAARSETPPQRVFAPEAPPPSGGFPLLRAAPETTWITVHLPGQSPCPATSALGSSHSAEELWCFEGAGGDSTWPANPPAGWRHWSKFDPPEAELSKWHVTTLHGGPSTGNFNAWGGCDSLGTNPDCDTDGWIFPDGYGDDWNYPLVLDCRQEDASAGGTIRFDLRWDCEELYDYLYLERETSPSAWQVMASFTGSGGWVTEVRPFPAREAGIRFRFRVYSDLSVSDADGSINTDGIAAIDNVEVVFDAGGSVVTDDFETGDFDGILSSGAFSRWQPLGSAGNAYDGWHLEYQPVYVNQGTTCDFLDDWMWAAKPAGGPIPANGFDFFLTTPAIDASDWTGGVVEYDTYLCMPSKRQDYVTTLVRVYDTATGWSLWNDFDGFITFEGCEFWARNERENLTQYLGPGVDSLQLAWELLDLSLPGSPSWGLHGSVQYLVDNVSIGSFDATATSFTARSIDLLADTFSLSDPAHTPFLTNAEQGQWIGTTGARSFQSAESLSVEIEDSDGMTAGNVHLWWRHDDGGGVFGAWAPKTMNLSIPGQGPGADGVYRTTIGNDAGGIEDLTPAGDERIWTAGTTVQYYLRVVDDLANASTFPPTASDPAPRYLEFSVLPFFRTSGSQGGQTYLVVADFAGRLLDAESSGEFDPDANGGEGAYLDPVLADPTLLVENALAELGLQHDRYDVIGSGSSVSSEPRGQSSSAVGLGGYLDDADQPAYDCIVWVHGNLGALLFDAATRLDLRTYLDAGGRFFACGDNVAFDLGAGGNAADVSFLRDYLGATFPSAADDATEARSPGVTGAPGALLEGVTLEVYSDCLHPREFDRLTLAPSDGAHTATARAVYTAGGPLDEGRLALARNERLAGGGVAVLAAFDVSALLTTPDRACVMGAVLAEFGLVVPSPPLCLDAVVDALGSRRLSFALRPAAPNPFRGETAIGWEVARRGPLEIAIYDVAGRRVRTLVDGVHGPGAGVEIWRGRTEAGARASAGIYFVRMRSAGFDATRKVVLVP